MLVREFVIFCSPTSLSRQLTKIRIKKQILKNTKETEAPFVVLLHLDIARIN